MSYVDLWGRNPDVLATAFDYPQPVIPRPMGPRTYLQLPAAASRIFGETGLRFRSADDVTVALDPVSTYERTERWKGLGGLGEDPPKAPITPQTAPVRSIIAEAAEFANQNRGFLMFAAGGLIVLSLAGIVTLRKMVGG